MSTMPLATIRDRSSLPEGRTGEFSMSKQSKQKLSLPPFWVASESV